MLVLKGFVLGLSELSTFCKWRLVRDRDVADCSHVWLIGPNWLGRPLVADGGLR